MKLSGEEQSALLLLNRHICGVFDTEEEWRSMTVSFVEEALKSGSRVVFLFDSHDPDEIKYALTSNGINVEEYIGQEQFVVIPATDIFVRDGVFDPGSSIAMLRHEADRSIADGYIGLCVCCEMTWSLKRYVDPELLSEYENRCTDLVAEINYSCLCQYDGRYFKPGILSDILMIHPSVYLEGKSQETGDLFRLEHDKGQADPVTSLARLKHAVSTHSSLLKDLEYNKQLIVNVVEKTEEGILVLSEEDKRVEYANAKAAVLFGRAVQDLIGLPLGTPILTDDMICIDIVTANGKPGTAEMRVQKIMWEKKPALLVFLRDITLYLEQTEELKTAKAQLEHVNEILYKTSIHDELTELLNRRGVETELWKEIVRIRRYGGVITALMIDCDRFKDINTRYGHVGGDCALREIAARINRIIRECDISCRLGGDEFLVLLPETRAAEGVVVAEKIRRQVAETPIRSAFGMIKTSVSIGVSQVSSAVSSLEDVLILTKHALQRSKDTGRNKVTLADSRLGGDTVMDDLLSEDYFSVFMQPIVDLKNRNQILDFDIFCKKSIKIDYDLKEIFNFAQNAGRLTELDLHILRVCAGHANKGYPIRYHLNLRASTLIEAGADEIGRALETGTRATFCIGFNENETTADLNALREIFDPLRKKGVRLSIKDVSFESRSLEMLLIMCPDFIWVKRSFISSLGEVPGRTKYWLRLLDMCKTLSSEILLEGIDSPADAELIESLGVRYAKGEFLGGLKCLDERQSE